MEISKIDIEDLPPYYVDFLKRNREKLSISLRENNLDGLRDLLIEFEKVLPTDLNFKELASIIFRLRNGSLYVRGVSGDFDLIGVEKTSDLLELMLDDRTIKHIGNIEQLLILHTHPSELYESEVQYDATKPVQIPVRTEGSDFSPEDNQAFTILGGRLQIFPNLQYASLGLVQANSLGIKLETGVNHGLAFGWSFSNSR